MAALFRRRPRRAAVGGPNRGVASVVALALTAGVVPTAGLVSLAAPAHAAPEGAGFDLNASDLRFILNQIKIAERHAAMPHLGFECADLLGTGADQIPSVGNNGEELPWGLRSVDGSCNNLLPEQENFGTSDQQFPRLVPAEFRAAEGGDPDADGPVQGVPSSSYDQKSGTVVDSQPRTISNLVVDQTSTNPAAVAAAGPGALPDASGTLLVPNTAPDTGLSAPFNSMFTLFGQFFDHGLDLVNKGGNGTVYVPLKADDPLVAGPDGQFNTTDDLPPRLRFMPLTRASNLPGPDGVRGTADDVQEHTNQTTPFIDQNQTYTSHPSHQVFLREFEMRSGRPVETGRLIENVGGPDGVVGDDPQTATVNEGLDDGGMATWSDVKRQAATMLGIRLADGDALNVPQLLTDSYGNFVRGPNGFPQLITRTAQGQQVLVEGNPVAPVAITANVVKTGHAFLDDIAHSAVPGGGKIADTDTTITPANARQPTGTYDDEMLAKHFIAGDGRVNENIGLTTVHHVFHSEHNRLVDDIKNVIATEDPGMLPEWRNTTTGVWDGDRLFQAAKFVTEMEYQHLAFEEFARKVQPMVNAFGEGGEGYHTGVNSAIRAEFAHAVYRFGHSMLTETVARNTPGPGNQDISLIEAFLNPPKFYDNGTATPWTADQAAGAVAMGMSRQTGNEIDEFVTEALRNNLLGLPLDLATINMARARDTGIPSLNAARRVFYAESGNSALQPYHSWADFGFSLKHPESLVNFIAAYGTHGDIQAESTVAGKRDVATAIVYGPAGPDGIDQPATQVGTDDPAAPQPADAFDFLNSRGDWANGANGVTITGVDAIDLWVGGLAEKQMVFGGLLGPTFNYVFETQMEDLQDGDRFYYLSRTAGLNLLTQLEGNSFAELIMRNTTAEGLPADVFSRPDYVFNVGALGNTGDIIDDPDTEYVESHTLSEPGMHLGRTPDGNGLRYRGPAHAVFNGTELADEVWASEGDDTIRGNGGNDWMQGGDGVDNHIGGEGDDILLDLNGDDTLKGGKGNDALSSGQGLGGDLNQGGPGSDFIVGGNDITETFAGPDDDFVFAGDSEDTVFGDDGNDWLEGGRGPFNLLQGDNGNPFQDDANGGHDVIDGDGGEQDMDSEGGDDIMKLGLGLQRAEGMLGFDWATHLDDPQPANSDMRFTNLLPLTAQTQRDRFDLVEGLSGWEQNDVLRGDDRSAVAGEPPLVPGHELTPEGINRINGLAGLLPTGTTSFSGGNIIIGGGGSDTIEGRGGDDIIDGDAWLNVRLSVRDASNSAVEIRSAGSMAELRSDVLNGTLNPGQIRIVREVLSTRDTGDVAVFSGLRADYDCTIVGDTEPLQECPTTPSPASGGDWNGEPIQVAHVRGNQQDGTDIVSNVERLDFADTRVPSTPTIGTATPGNGTATVRWTPPPADLTPISGYEVRVVNAATNAQVGVLRPAGATATSLVVSGLQNGTTYRFQVRAFNANGPGFFSGLSNAVTPTAPNVAGAPTIGTATPGNAQATVRWTAPLRDGGSPITSYEVRVVNDLTGNQVGALRTAPGTATSLVVTGLTNGTPYRFQVRAVNAQGASPYSAFSNVVTPATVPGAPTIGEAAEGNESALVRWTPPASNGGSPIIRYEILVFNDDDDVQEGPLRTAGATATSLLVTGLTNGTTYRFQVRAVNAIGPGPFSRESNGVDPSTTPDEPIIGTASSGVSGGGTGLRAAAADVVTATARWGRPVFNGGARITAYRVTALRLNREGRVVRRTDSHLIRPDRRSLTMMLWPGRYRFVVKAKNAAGWSKASKRSNRVVAR